MNAPDFNFGPERRERGLTVVGDRRDLAPEVWRSAEMAPAGPDGPNLRDQFFKILGLALKHRWLILACCIGGLVIGFLVTFTSTPIYRATATIQVDLAAAKIVKLDTPDNSSQVDSYRFYQTQRELLQSRSLAERVASNLDLSEGGFVNPRPASSWAKLKRMIFPDKPAEKLDRADGNAAAAGLSQGAPPVVHAQQSGLVAVSFDSRVPAGAAKSANGVAQRFTDLDLQRRYGASA